MFSVFLFAADPEKLREQLASDMRMVPEIASRMKHRHGSAPLEIDNVCRRIEDVRSLEWPAANDQLSVDALLWMLDYAAEPITVARIQGIRYPSLIDEISLLDEVVAKPGPLPMPDVSNLQCEIGFLAPHQLRELAERGPPPPTDPHVDAGTELIEIFRSLADDGLGLYTIVDGAKLRQG